MSHHLIGDRINLAITEGNGKMSNPTSLTGMIKAEPPIPHSVLAAHQELTDSEREAYIATARTTQETPDGTLVSVTGTGVRSSLEGDFSPHELDGQLEEIAQAFPGTQWRGYLDGRDDYGTFRIVFRDGHFTEERPHWDDEEYFE